MGNKFCTKCGAELKPGLKFCTKCGNPIKVESKENTTTEPSLDVEAKEEIRRLTVLCESLQSQINELEIQKELKIQNNGEQNVSVAEDASDDGSYSTSSLVVDIIASIFLCASALFSVFPIFVNNEGYGLFSEAGVILLGGIGTFIFVISYLIFQTNKANLNKKANLKIVLICFMSFFLALSLIFSGIYVGMHIMLVQWWLYGVEFTLLPGYLLLLFNFIKARVIKK